VIVKLLLYIIFSYLFSYLVKSNLMDFYLNEVDKLNGLIYINWKFKVCCRLIHTFGRRGRNLQSTRCVLGGK
jgi:hypothetical protein